MKQVAFLGHVILKGGIYVDPSKVQDVLSWNAPTSVGDIQSFLGLVGYYQRIFEDMQAHDRVCTCGYMPFVYHMHEWSRYDRWFR
jgi:hypothetical protein